MSLSWNKDEIRNLRRRLGWTQADLARRLQCTLTEIDGWETNNTNPSQQIIHQLEMLEMQAQQCSEEVHNIPVAEGVCQQKALSQVDFNKIGDGINE